MRCTRFGRTTCALFAVLMLASACSSSDDGAAVAEPISAEPADGFSAPASPQVVDGAFDPSNPDAVAALVIDPASSVVATVEVGSIEIFVAPDGSVQRTLPQFDPEYNPGGIEAVKQVFLVRDIDGEWLNVLLPVRPNGTTGWVRRSEVSLSAHDFHIVIELGAHQMTTFSGTEIVQQVPIGVGTNDTPTPGGDFYLNVLLRPPNPNSVYGSFAFGLNGFSNTLKEFAGGEGVIGIHGTNRPDSIGSDVSAGCIRLTNDNIEELVGVLPLGTPVEIRA